ncbi:family 16 glycoside hydrolase [Trichoderma barbatum]
MELVWDDPFVGCPGCSPNFTEWIVPPSSLHTNNEWQTYTSSPSNLQLSGSQTLQIVPRNSPQGWTSSRIESVRSWTPNSGKITQIQASFRTGTGGTYGKQGMWPAFWMLGDSLRRGTPWPFCGELDIFEQINGAMAGQGTIHCEQSQSQTCGMFGKVTIPNDSFHTWVLRIDRTPTTWQAETLEWYMDGIPFFKITGTDISNQTTWSTIAQSPMYIILNLAVGGDWPGNPDNTTQDGYSSMMEIQYVAIYESA